MLCLDRDNGNQVVSVRLEVFGRSLTLQTIGDQHKNQLRYTNQRVQDVRELVVAECKLEEFDLLRKHGFGGEYKIDRLYLPVPPYLSMGSKLNLEECVLLCMPAAIFHPDSDPLLELEWTIMPSDPADYSAFFDAAVFISDNFK